MSRTAYASNEGKDCTDLVGGQVPTSSIPKMTLSRRNVIKSWLRGFRAMFMVLKLRIELLVQVSKLDSIRLQLLHWTQRYF